MNPPYQHVALLLDNEFVYLYYISLLPINPDTEQNLFSFISFQKQPASDIQQTARPDLFFAGQIPR